MTVSFDVPRNDQEHLAMQRGLRMRVLRVLSLLFGLLMLGGCEAATLARQAVRRSPLPRPSSNRRNRVCG